MQSLHHRHLARRLGSRGSSVRVRVVHCVVCLLCILVRHTVSTMAAVRDSGITPSAQYFDDERAQHEYGERDRLLCIDHQQQCR